MLIPLTLGLLFSFFFALNGFCESKIILKTATRCLSPKISSQEKIVQAKKKITLEAKNGDVGSQYLLGKYFMALNPRVKNNQQKTLYWLKKALNNGHTGAGFALGLYFLKQGAKKSLDSKNYLVSAANNGEPFAQYLLSIVLENGLACQKDPTEAERWREKAESQGIDWEAFIREEQILMEGIDWNAYLTTEFLKKE